MRYGLETDGDVLAWCLKHDTYPNVVPLFPKEKGRGLVVAHLIGGAVKAEVLVSAEHLVEVCGTGFPMGRLYFQIPKSALYKVCPRLSDSVYGES